MRSTTLFARAGSIVLVATLAMAACGDDDPAATVAFAEPADGATIEEAGDARGGAGQVRPGR